MEKLAEQAPYLAALVFIVVAFLQHQHRLAKLFVGAMADLTKAVDGLRETLR